ncbi:MAG: DUF2889 domain-containing protein [Deltaproteobacteria bacterium]|nr:DUF2889 domain-containing protein [Deltaproteobacteria bacterium]
MNEQLNIKEMINGKPIHSRSLDLKTYPVDDDHIVVEGWLKDERFRKVYDIDGQIKDPGPVHHMAIRILVGGMPLTIIDAEAEMPHVPHHLCPSTRDSIKRVIGLEIKSGFGENVHRLIGGIEGCAHLTHLFTVMSQEALHGYWNNKMTKKPIDPGLIGDKESLAFLVNSCQLWREGGPLISEFKGLLDG